jgi:hypothetical protein
VDQGGQPEGEVGAAAAKLGARPGFDPCESPHSGVRLPTRKVCRWRDGKMMLRWAAAALLMTEKDFWRIMGHKDL